MNCSPHAIFNPKTGRYRPGNSLCIPKILFLCVISVTNSSTSADFSLIFLKLCILQKYMAHHEKCIFIELLLGFVELKYLQK